MTPTNEAGHGLPELPVPWADYWASKGNWALSHNYAAFELADEWLRANLDALALSRGVPGVEIVAYLIDGRVEQGLAFDKQAAEDMAFANAGTVVPLARADAISLPAGLPKGWYVERVSGDADLYVLRTPKGLEWIVEPHERLHVLLTAMLAAAPAAAGAQGEAVCSNCNGRGEVGGPVGQTAETFDYVTEPCPECTPQPAAADGGVRERARELLAQQFDTMNPLYAECIRKASPTDIDDSPHVDAALRAISAALSSHRQAGDESLYELHSRFLSDTSRLPEEWQDWRNDFARDIRALVEKGAG